MQSTARLDLIIEKSVLLDSKRKEVEELETELLNLTGNSKKTRKAHAVAEPELEPESNGKKPARAKTKIIRVLSTARASVKIQEIQNKIKMSEGATQSAMKALIADELVVRTGHGMYCLKKYAQN